MNRDAMNRDAMNRDAMNRDRDATNHGAMNRRDPTAALQRAAELSRELTAVADRGDVHLMVSLDAERMQLLKSFRLERKQLDAADRALLQEISQLNDRAIGLMEHHRRSKERAIDMAAVGRRAVAAYSSTRRQQR
jgi:hypothetical protein